MALFGTLFLLFIFASIWLILHRQTGSGAGVQHSKATNNSDMEEKILSELAEIKAYSRLGAKTVLNLDDVAMLTGLSKSHLYKLTCNRQIPYYKPNSRLLYFDRAEVEAWMKQNRVTPQMEAEQAAINHVVRKEARL